MHILQKEMTFNSTRTNSGFLTVDFYGAHGNREQFGLRRIDASSLGAT
jgi:hypothetical protein